MKIGIIGSGQLARMLVLAGTPLGVTFTCIGNPNDCAGDVASVVDIDLHDTNVLLQWATSCDVVTFENENINCDLIKNLHKKTNVYPPLKSLQVAQDRLVEKNTMSNIGVKTAPYENITTVLDLHNAVEKHGMPAIVKTRQFGYDGKGQFKINDRTDILKAWEALGNAPDGLIYEGFINFDFEVSQIFSRNVNGDIVFYPLTHNVHDKGILLKSTAPYTNDSLTQQAQDIATKISEDLDYVGTLAIEFFVDGDTLIVNEIAPRVHNSGHWTIEGATTSQFENHIRAICNLKLGATDTQYTVMLNCLGKIPSVRETSYIDSAKRHDYHKGERFGRKVGHMTLVMNADNASSQLKELQVLVEKYLEY